MPERYDLAAMLKEIEEDEGLDAAPKGQASQDKIKEMLAKKKAATEKNDGSGS